MPDLIKSMIVIVTVLFVAGSSCDPLFSYTKQYSCSLPGEDEPVNSEAYVERAKKHLEISGKMEDPGGCAVGACAEAIRLDPTNSEAYLCRSYINAHYYPGEDTLDLALSDIEEAIRLDPEDVHFYRQKSLIHEYKEMPEEAFADLFKVIEIGEKNGTVDHRDYAKRAEMLLERKRYKETVADLDKAIRIKPDEFFYLLDRARANFELERYEEVVNDCSEMIRLDPESFFGYSCRGDAYEKLGETELSAKDLQRSGELQALRRQTKQPRAGGGESRESPAVTMGGFGRP